MSQKRTTMQRRRGKKLRDKSNAGKKGKTKKKGKQSLMGGRRHKSHNTFGLRGKKSQDAARIDKARQQGKKMGDKHGWKEQYKPNKEEK